MGLNSYSVDENSKQQTKFQDLLQRTQCTLFVCTLEWKKLSIRRFYGYRGIWVHQLFKNIITNVLQM